MKKLHPTAIVVISSCIFLALIMLLPSIRDNLYKDHPPVSFYGLYIALLLGILGIPGFFFIANQEAPSMDRFTTIKGRKAIVSGVVWIMMFYLPAIIILTKALLKM